MAKIPITYLIIYGEIKRKGGGSRLINIRDIRPIIKWRIRIPTKYHFKVIKELCYFGLLRKKSRDDYEIIECYRRPPTDSLGEPFW